MAVNKVIFAGDVLIDLSKDTVTPDVLKKGYFAHQANGEQIVGTYEGTDENDVDSILLNGFQNGDILVKDDGVTYVQENTTTGQTLEKTFDGDVCRIILKNREGASLGELIKTFSDEYSVITYDNKNSGSKIVKTFQTENGMIKALTVSKNDTSKKVESLLTKHFAN